MFYVFYSQAQLNDVHRRWSEREGEVEEEHNLELALSHTLHLVGVMVSWRNGTRITHETQLSQASGLYMYLDQS